MTMDISYRNYFAALSQINRAAYLACFGQDAVVHDPYGGRPLQGVDGLNRFMDNMERTWAAFSMEPGESFTAGDRTAVGWKAKATTKAGKTAEFAGINVFTFDDTGLICQLEAYWDVKAMLSQIS